MPRNRGQTRAVTGALPGRGLVDRSAAPSQRIGRFKLNGLSMHGPARDKVQAQSRE